MADERRVRVLKGNIMVVAHPADSVRSVRCRFVNSKQERLDGERARGTLIEKPMK